MSRNIMHLSQKLHQPLENERVRRDDRSIGETARALLHQTLRARAYALH